jgi:hypothetical protein
VQFESWRFPLLDTKRQHNVTSSFQLTFWPKPQAGSTSDSASQP